MLVNGDDAPRSLHTRQDGPMSSDVTVVLLFTLAGFLLGGAFSTWKNARPLAIGLGVCAALAAIGAVVWLL